MISLIYQFILLTNISSKIIVSFMYLILNVYVIKIMGFSLADLEYFLTIFFIIILGRTI